MRSFLPLPPHNKDLLSSLRLYHVHFTGERIEAQGGEKSCH